MTINIKETLPIYLSIAAIIVLFFIVEYNLLSKGFFALSADESGHTLEAYEWYKGDAQLFSIWLPFNKIVNGITLRLHYDLLVTPRITSVLFGLLTLLSIILLTYYLFENRIVAIITGFFATIFLPISVFSVLPLSEIYYFFFVISSISIYVLWLKTNKNVFLWLTVILSAIGTTTRYESWLFALFIFLLIGYELLKTDRSLKQKTLLITAFAIIIAAFPLYWIYLSAIGSENIHGFVSTVAGRYHEGKLIAEIKNNALYLFFMINIASLNIIGLASVIHVSKTSPFVKKYTMILFGTLITFSLLSFFIKAMPTHNHWRIVMIWCLLLLPLTTYWLYNLLESSKSSPINKYAFIIFFFLLVYFFNAQTANYTSSSYLTREEINIGKYLNEITQSDNSKIYIMKDGSDKWRYSNLLISSQKPDQFVIELENFKYVSSDTISISHKLISELLNYRIKFIAIPSRTILRDSARYLSEIKPFKQWKVYEMNEEK